MGKVKRPRGGENGGGWRRHESAAIARSLACVQCYLPALDEGGGRTVALAPCYVGVLLTVAYHTGRRISSICRLTRDRMIRDAGGAIVAIRWPPLKEEDEKEVPVRAEVGTVLAAQLARVDAWAAVIGWTPGPRTALFPRNLALTKWTRPMPPPPAIDRHTATAWLTRAEALAVIGSTSLPKLISGLWHPYRRSFPTRRKHLPRRDVADAAGWKDQETMARCYEQGDADTLRRVLDDDTRLGQ